MFQIVEQFESLLTCDYKKKSEEISESLESKISQKNMSLIKKFDSKKNDILSYLIYSNEADFVQYKENSEDENFEEETLSSDSCTSETD